MTETLSRRPLKSRQKPWANSTALELKKLGVQPNVISVASSFFALVGALGLYLSSSETALTSPIARGLILLGVVLGILGRLLCNLLDGMVAVEGGLKTPSGEVFNDLPDRISDLCLFVGLGFAAAANSFAQILWIQLGWATACLAVLTAYLRYLGAGSGVGHFFIGPMAKQHRMAALIAGTIASALLEPTWIHEGTIYRITLSIILIGTLITCVNRTLKIIRALEAP